MVKYLSILLFFILSFTKLYSQNADSLVVQRDTIRKDTIKKIPVGIIDGQEVPHIALKEFIVFPPRVFKNKRQKRRYDRLTRYVKKVYPYSQIIKRKLREINAVIDTISTKKARRKYLRKSEKELRAEFEGQLKKLTFKQGRILIKLIDRETGETTYELVKKLKGGFSAVFWQSIARIFGSNLKAEYNADGEDKMIEEIVILLENGQL